MLQLSRLFTHSALCVASITLAFPIIAFAQANAGSLDEIDSARLIELQEKYESRTITESELTEYAEMNSGNSALQAYLPQPAVEQQTTASVDPGARTYVSSQLYEAVAKKNQDLQQLVLTLAAVVFINLVLTLYIMFRKRHA